MWTSFEKIKNLVSIGCDFMIVILCCTLSIWDLGHLSRGSAGDAKSNFFFEGIHLLVFGYPRFSNTFSAAIANSSK